MTSLGKAREMLASDVISEAGMGVNTMSQISLGLNPK